MIHVNYNQILDHYSRGVAVHCIEKPFVWYSANFICFNAVF